MNEEKKSTVYRYPLYYANFWHENMLWAESTRRNIDCKNKIENEIALNYHNDTFDAETAVKNVMEEFSMERIVWVAANTIHHRAWDGRISVSNKDWANHIHVLEHDPKNDYDMSDQYVIDGCNMGLVNMFVDALLEIDGAMLVLMED